jgi:hypothetical protein
MTDTNSPAEESALRGGPEVDIGLFSRVQQLISSVRLTQDERVAVTTGDLAADVHIARKEFEMEHFEEAFRAVNRISSGFDQKVAQWESRARQKESQKQKLSMLDIRKMTAEHAGVRSRVELVRAQVRRLRVGLDQIVNSADSPAISPASAESGPEPADPSGGDRLKPALQTAGAATEPAPDETSLACVPPPETAPSLLPRACREAFQAAGDQVVQESVVRQYFDVEAELSVEIKSVQGRNRVSFQPFPLPPLDRLYFVRETGQLILLQSLTAKTLNGHDALTGNQIQWAVKDFVQHVRSGVWLLRPKSPAA